MWMCVCHQKGHACLTTYARIVLGNRLSDIVVIYICTRTHKATHIHPYPFHCKLLSGVIGQSERVAHMTRKEMATR